MKFVHTGYPFLLTLLLFIAGCSESPLCVRIGADYFPSEIGHKWVFRRASPSGTDTIQIKVVDTTNVYSRNCLDFEQNGEPGYWWISDMRIDKLFYQIVFANGEEDTIAQAWVPWLQLPFVLNNAWEYSFSNQAIIFDDTVKVGLQTKGQVISLTGNTFEVKTQLIETQLSKYFGTYSDTSIYYEWYAPDTGVVKRVINDTTETLIYSSTS